MKSFIVSLHIANVRNLRSSSVEFCSRANLLVGNNGQGKTSLLEAVYLVATSRSFRTHRLRDVVTHGESVASVRATFESDEGLCEQYIGIDGSQRVLKIEGSKPESVTDYATRVPVVVFHPGEINLTSGPASYRRTLIDRVALFLDRSSYHHTLAYTRAMRSRQRLLGADLTSQAIDAFEHLMAVHGCAITTSREAATQQVITATRAAFSQIAPSNLRLEGVYDPGGTTSVPEALERLRSNRETDRRRGAAAFGPHRDDIVLKLDGRPIRAYGSQGQHRLATLGLKVGEMMSVEAATGRTPLLLLDDVSSELDADRTEALLQLLDDRQGQVMVTSTRPELLRGIVGAGKDLCIFRVEDGDIQARTGWI